MTFSSPITYNFIFKVNNDQKIFDYFFTTNLQTHSGVYHSKNVQEKIKVARKNAAGVHETKTIKSTNLFLFRVWVLSLWRNEKEEKEEK